MRQLIAATITRAVSRLVLAVLAVVVFAHCARATVVYWDTNGDAAGTGAAPSGTWDRAATANWTGDPSGAATTFAWSDGNTADFTAGTAGVDATAPYTVTISGTVSPAGIAAAMSGDLIFSGGTLNPGSGGLSIAAGAGAVTLNSAVSITASQTWVNASDRLLTVGGSVTTSKSLSLAGTGPVLLNGAASGAGSLTIAGATVSLAGGGSDFSGGTTLSSGLLRIAANATLSSGTLVTGPLGKGLLTLAGGAIGTANGAARTVVNTFRLAGDVAFGQVGDPASAALTFNPTLVTNPSQNVPVIAGARRLTVWIGTQLTGPISGSSSPSLTVVGPATLTLRNDSSTTATTIGNVTVGDGLPGRSLGGNLVVQSGATSVNTLQNALGNGDYTIAYGGVLRTIQSTNTTVAIAPFNTFNVQGGGLLSFGGGGTGGDMPGAITAALSSGAAVQNNMGNGRFLKLAPASLPAAGAICFGGLSTIAIQGAWPALTGDLTVGGSASAGGIPIAPGGFADNLVTTTAAGTLSSNGGARKMTFNNGGALLGDYGGGVSLAGLTLNAALTVDGGGFASLGRVTGTGTIVKSGPGVLAISANTNDAAPNNSTFAGSLTVRGGAVQLPAGSVTARGLPNATITLDGGALRIGGTAAAATYTDPIAVGPGGGGLETVATSAGGLLAATFGGPISGAGTLVLRPGGTAAETSVLHVGGDNRTFGGGLVVATLSGRGGTVFDNSNALGGAGNTVTVSPGSVLGFGFTPAAADWAKITLQPGAILALDGLSGTLDVTADYRLGLAGGSATVPALTIHPLGDTYKLNPTNAGTMRFNVANQLTGTGCGLQILAGVVPSGAAPGAMNVQTGSVQFDADQDFGGAMLVRGTVHPGGATGIGDVFVNRSLAGAAALTVDVSSRTTIGGAGGRMPAVTSLSVEGGSTLQIGSSTVGENTFNDRINPAAVLSLGGDGSGTLTLAFPATSAWSQTLAGLHLAAGGNAINTANTPAGGILLTFAGAAAGNYTRAAGGTLTIATPTTVPTLQLAFATAPISANGVRGGLLVGTVLRSQDFVTVTAGSAVAYTGYTTQNNAANWAAGQDITNSAGFSGTTPAGTLIINSLRAAIGAVDNNIAIGTDSAHRLVVDSGMILLAAGNTGATTIAGAGSLTSGNGADLIVLRYGGSAATIAAPIVGDIGLTFLGAGGTLKLAGNNAFSGDVYVERYGTVHPALELAAQNALGIGAKTVSLLGGDVAFSTVDQSYGSAVAFTVGPEGGNFYVQNASAALAGGLTLAGPSGVFLGGGSTAGRLTCSGNLSGAGAIALGTGGAVGGQLRFVLAGDNRNWSGGVQANGAGGGAVHVRFASGTAAGSGPIVVAAGNPNFYFDTDAAGPTTAGNAWLFNAQANPNDANQNTSASLSFWGLGPGWSAAGPSNMLTLTGPIDGSGSLVFQGDAADANHVSEIVLAGRISLYGSPGVYSYGTSTQGQNFVNGQGGITLGTTGRVGLRQTAAALLLDSPAAENSVAAGALGLIRFGSAATLNNMVAGPGYYAALRLAGQAHDGQFGYLLTGTPDGTTYEVPGGKSFVIGSLGAGPQVGGTFGLAGDAAGPNVGTLQDTTINVHANAADDAQVLYVLARGADDRLVLGAAGKPVIFAPTYGDSGNSLAMTVMSARTAAGATTTLVKVGQGTVELANVLYGQDGSAANQFSWSVAAGKLIAAQGIGNGGEATPAGSTSVAAGAELQAKTIRQAVLALDGKATITATGLSPGAPGRAADLASTVNVVGTALTVAATGLLDLNDNDLILKAGAGQSEGDLQALIAAGYGAGHDWSGAAGLTSSAAALNSSLYGLGYGLVSNTIKTTTFDGQAVNDDDLIVKYTYKADLNLDGLMNGNDVIAFAAGYGHGTQWCDGNVTYHAGPANGNDVIAFAAAYNAAAVPLPEPGGLALLALAVAGGLLWCRRISGQR